MKVAILGTGKTGSHVKECLEPGDEAREFNSTKAPTLADLQAADVIISFLPGDPFVDYIPLLLESGRPVVTGSTGFTWPDSLADSLEEKGITWVKASNFALGMNFLFLAMEDFAKSALLKPEGVAVHEVHHVHKKDKPSGTALQLATRLGRPALPITAEREGDVNGVHTVTLDLPGERITICHEALDRKVFAAGAVRTAHALLAAKTAPGLIDLADFLRNSLKEETQ